MIKVLFDKKGTLFPSYFQVILKGISKILAIKFENLKINDFFFPNN